MTKREIKFNSKNHKYSIIIEMMCLSFVQRLKFLCPNTKNVAIIFDKNVPAKFKKDIKKI